MDRRKLGGLGLDVSAQGLGCVGMTHAYGSGDEQPGLETIHRALELGITFLDTAEVYGPHTNEQLVGRAIAGQRDEFQIATKFGFVIDPERPSDRTVDGRQALQENLELADRVTELAEQRGITPAQLALAWVMAKGEDIVPIPGTKSPRRLEENAAAVEIKLSAEDVEELDNAISAEAVRGERYPEGMMALLNN
jgi:aryl-alcohol dehydrogenase-like predicted oxidoreductase